MTALDVVDIRRPVADALRAGQPVVALESTLIAHGLPWPVNVDTARAAESAIRSQGVVPATIAVLQGRPTVGVSDGELQELAQSKDVMKASRRDLGVAMAQHRTAATTVAATMLLAYRAGIRILATGGIGGAHPPLTPSQSDSGHWDISADLWELAHTPIAVVCAGAKSILDVPRTLEILETYCVPVVGFQTNEFPAFYVRSSGERISASVESPEQAAELLEAHWQLGAAGVVLAQPISGEMALQPERLDDALRQAQATAADSAIGGKELTPYLLDRLAELTAGETLRANQALVVANARLAAQIAVAWSARCRDARAEDPPAHRG
jgi:pseudouridine-5'-phosphate glycosidase